MPHVVLALYICGFAGGITLIVVTFLASQRFESTSFWHFGLLFISAMLMLIVEAMKTYEKAVQGDFGLALHVTAAVLSLCANALMSYMLPLVVFQIVRLPISPRRRITHILMAACLGSLGGLKEVVAPFILWNANYVALLGLHVYGAIILVSNYNSIEHPWLRSLIRSFLLFFAACVPLAVAQLVLHDIPSSPPIVRDYPLEPILYYLGFVVLVLLYAARYLFAPSPVRGYLLPDGFVRRYGISHRESDIISMIVHGYSNRTIGEKLFISSMTVKNHVYHIYQKTGAENKVQLLNLINSPK